VTLRTIIFIIGMLLGYLSSMLFSKPVTSTSKQHTRYRTTLDSLHTSWNSRMDELKKQMHAYRIKVANYENQILKMENAHQQKVTQLNLATEHELLEFFTTLDTATTFSK